ncbi:hypothetical protein BC835DRAFT_1516556 [Cytidiella melzeri]|nr:hypothetical protein BC835DRAFT_1516556 [Cytidiella melzeri]
MRRTHSGRNHAKAHSLAVGNDDLSVLKETEDGLEDILRRQVIEQDRVNDKLQSQILQLKAQLAERPPLEIVQDLRKEYTNLELLLQGTQRENERCMAELERAKAREKALECHLEKLAGPNWQDNLDIMSPSNICIRSGMKSPVHTRTNSVPQSANSPAATSSQADSEATKAYIEQVRLLVLGMDQRLQDREEKLMKTIEAAEGESTKFEEARKSVTAK